MLKKDKLKLLELQIEAEKISKSLISITYLISQWKELTGNMIEIPTTFFDAIYGQKDEEAIIKHLEDYYLLLRPKAKKLTELIHNTLMEMRLTNDGG